MQNVFTKIKLLISLSRLNKPIGIWLLLFPCMFALGISAQGLISLHPIYLIAFFIGATAMRSFGCVYNDFVDRKLDRQVERTKTRPLASGQISSFTGLLLLFFWGLMGFWILMHFDPFTISLGLSSLLLVALYPFMKRWTWWPQAFLGITFNWGVLMGWSAVKEEITLPTLTLYAACFFWTLGYDTIYGHQDKEDDIRIGVKSTALLWKDKTKPFLIICYGLCWFLMVTTGLLTMQTLLYFVACLFVLCHFIWQIRFVDLSNPTSCLKVFKSNFIVGCIMTIAVSGY